MSRKSSWWLRPQRKGASNRAALNEANYFMEHNKVLRERINELAAENAKLREMLAEDNEELAKMRRVIDYLYSFAKACGVDAEDVRELGIEV